MALELLPDLAVGAVVGSCIANFGLIVGISALVKPLAVGFRLLTVALPLLLAAVAATMIMGWDGEFGKVDGSLLLLFAVGTLTLFDAVMLAFFW